MLRSCFCLPRLRLRTTPLVVPLHRRQFASQTTLGPKRTFLPTNPLLRTATYLGLSFGILTGSCGVLLLGLLVYDSTTYSDEKQLQNLPNSPLSLKSHRGGRKNLKIADELLGDRDAAEGLTKKPQLVVVGGGWGGVGLINSLDPDSYNLILIAPENYNLFTPLLPSATVGTVEPRSLVEPLRKIISRIKGHYLQAFAVDVDLPNRLVEVQPTDLSLEPFYIPYDKLVIAVGSISNTHGVPGLEHCSQLKTINDVRDIRAKVINNLEVANLPTVDEEERKRLLSFVVCGGGPTGVEFASELYDMINEDMLKYFPRLLGQEASIHLIQSRDHILNTYSEKISQYAENRFSKAEIDTILNARVKEITPIAVTYTLKDKSQHSIPSGFVLWSTGIAMNPFTQKVAAHLPNQYHKHALEVDSQLRVKGVPRDTVYALGDASTIETNLVDHLLELVDQCDKNGDGKIGFEEFEQMMVHIQRKFPTSQLHIQKVRDVFERYDADHDNSLGLNELADLFKNISNRLTTLPATAQVANQQGKYLAKKLNLQVSGTQSEEGEPFVYRHLGSLAYIGNSAVFDFGGKYGSFGGGIIAAYLVRNLSSSPLPSLIIQTSDKSSLDVFELS